VFSFEQSEGASRSVFAGYNGGAGSVSFGNRTAKGVL